MAQLADPAGTARRLLLRQQRGLDDPALGAARLTPYPAVIASPLGTPTRGVANAGSAISGGENANSPRWDDRRFQYLGAAPVSVTLGTPTYGRCETWVEQTVVNQAMWSVEIMADCRYVEFIHTNPNSGFFKLWIDGQPATETAWAGPSSTTAQYRELIDLGGRAVRHLLFEMSGQTYFRGLAHEMTGAMWEVPHPKPPPVTFLTDSFGDYVSGVYDPMDAWPVYCARVLGWRNIYRLAQGGTGYLNSGSTGKRTFVNRVSDIPSDTSLVVVQGSTNDAGLDSPAGTLATAATALYSAIRTRVPVARLVVVLPFEFGQNQQASVAALRTAIQPVAATYADLVIDPGGESGQWTTGNGRVGATDGAGSADLYRHSDNLHPTVAGAQYFGRKVAARIAAELPL